MRTHMSGYEAYKANLCVLQHFKQPKFDLFAGSRIRFAEDKFDARPDNVFYHKIAEKYPKGDVFRFCAVNILNGKTHISMYNDVDYREWKSRMGGIEYTFEKDCKTMYNFAVKNGATFKDLFASFTGGLPIVLQMTNGNHIMFETICMIDDVLGGGIINQMDNQITDTFIYPNLRQRIIKYTPWILHDRDSTLCILRKFI